MGLCEYIRESSAKVLNSLWTIYFNWIKGLDPEQNLLRIKIIGKYIACYEDPLIVDRIGGKNINKSMRQFIVKTFSNDGT